MTTRVFAYGSNMCLGRIRAEDRCPSARPIAIGVLRGHVLRFHKKSTDGSAKADALATANTNDVVWGVIYEIADRERFGLDRSEGLGHGYVAIDVTPENWAGGCVLI